MLRTAPRVVDVRPAPLQERHALLFASVDALPEGETFLLVHDQDPKRLLSRLQAERPGAYEWWPLEEGPGVWRIEIRRRAGATGRSVSEFLGADHDRLDALMEKVRARVAAGSCEEASRPFAEFRTGLLRHIRLEEALLFPAFEQATGLTDSGPTAVMRAEHREIGGLLDRMTAALGAPERAAVEFEPLRAALVEVLTTHNEKEEQVVYPLTDRSLPPRKRDELLERMLAA